VGRSWLRLADTHDSALMWRPSPQFVIAGGIRTYVGLRVPVVLVRAGKSVARHSVRTQGHAVITLKNFATT
jgi:hypothetical protein